MLSTNTKSQSNTRVRRKNIKFSFLISLIILSLISCEEEELNRESSCNENEAIFTSTIRSFIIEFAKTRATGTNWDKQDAIGIYAIEAEQELNEESIYNGYSNIKYINTTSGEVANYSAADNKILLPVNNQTFNFISYYPYTSNITEFTIPIDITVQEPREDINIMYATSKGHTWDNSNVEFEFQRVLSSIVIHLSSKEGIDLQGATITIENANTNKSEISKLLNELMNQLNQLNTDANLTQKVVPLNNNSSTTAPVEREKVDTRITPEELKAQLEQKAEEALKQSRATSNIKNREQLLKEREKLRETRLKEREKELKERERRREAQLRQREKEREERIREQKR